MKKTALIAALLQPLAAAGQDAWPSKPITSWCLFRLEAPPT